MTVEVGFTLNGEDVHTSVEGDELLADCLRERMGRTGTVLGCREGVCGSCNVLIDGTVTRSCLVLAAQIEGCDVVTVEGLVSDDSLSPLQRAFVDEGAVQCGFCTPGLLIAATALLEERPSPTRAEIVEALSGNLCRCTGYVKVVRAVEVAAGGGQGS
ncbi:MAG: 2Fe-2S iron-sulfur cluster binding domain-containing protein [Actinophytocola sp.]|nr:2Fe-2S iron-sulfur cluster binding domain-containing protein [Actinophytocola sp.]